MFEEFKKFILRGNVIDLAVGVIIGAAFGGIVTSLVNDILMPPIGWATGGVNFTDLGIPLGEKLDPATQKNVPVVIKYGAFLQKVFDFLIVAACMFILIKAVNKLQRKKDEVPPAPNASEKLLAEIRDLLKARSTA